MALLRVQINDCSDPSADEDRLKSAESVALRFPELKDILLDREFVRLEYVVECIRVRIEALDA